MLLPSNSMASKVLEYMILSQIMDNLFGRAIYPQWKSTWSRAKNAQTSDDIRRHHQMNEQQ